MDNKTGSEMGIRDLTDEEFSFVSGGAYSYDVGHKFFDNMISAGGAWVGGVGTWNGIASVSDQKGSMLNPYYAIPGAVLAGGGYLGHGILYGYEYFRG